MKNKLLSNSIFHKVKDTSLSIIKHFGYTILFAILTKYALDYMTILYLLTYNLFDPLDWSDPYRGYISSWRIGLLFMFILWILIVFLSAGIAKVFKANYSFYISIVLAHIMGIYTMVISIQNVDGFMFLTLYCIVIYITVLGVIIGASATLND